MVNVIEVFTNTYSPYGVVAAVDGCARAGLSHVELSIRAKNEPVPVFESGVLGADTPEEAIDAFAAYLKEKGVRVITANSGGDLEDRAVVERVRRCLGIAKRLGATQMVIACPKKSKAVLDHLLELADAALELGIRLALETHPPLVTNAEAGLATMRELNHKNIGINYDVANVYYYNERIDTLAELEKLIDHITHVHLKDSRKRYQDWYFPALGQGEIELDKVITRLNRAGFYGPMSIEIEGIKGEPQPTLEEIQRRVEDSVRYLESIGAR